MYNLIVVVIFACQVRLRAMRSLHQFPPGDLLANENWPELKHSLQKTLKDPNASLSVCCLSIYVCIITSYYGIWFMFSCICVIINGKGCNKYFTVNNVCCYEYAMLTFVGSQFKITG